MSCCGGKRAQLYGARPNNAVMIDHARALAPTQARTGPSPMIFEYVGASGITTVGAVTRKLYRFDGRGARSAVDPRDAPALARLPDLRCIT